MSLTTDVENVVSKLFTDLNHFVVAAKRVIQSDESTQQDAIHSLDTVLESDRELQLILDKGTLRKYLFLSLKPYSK